MTWWTELPHWTRELIAMWGTFMVLVLLICGAAWLVEWQKR